MTHKAAYQRILIKVSGEALCAPGGFGLDPAAIEELINELRPVAGLGVQTAIVVGGGNFLRGKTLAQAPYIDRPLKRISGSR